MSGVYIAPSVTWVHRRRVARLAARATAEGLTRLHPLAPVVLHTEPEWTQDLLATRFASMRAFVLFHAYEARHWPYNRPYWFSQWQPVDVEANLTYINCLSAAIASAHEEIRSGDMYLGIKVRNFAVNGVHHALIADPSRSHAMRYMFEIVLRSYLGEEDAIQKKLRLSRVTGWLGFGRPSPATDEYGNSLHLRLWTIGMAALGAVGKEERGRCLGLLVGGCRSW